MESIRFIKIWLCLLVCLCIGLNAQAQTTPDRPILESVSVDPQTGFITISWSMPSPQLSPVNVDEFVVYWYETQPSQTNHIIATIPNPATRSYTIDTTMVRILNMPDPRTTSVPFTVAAVNRTPYSISLRSYEDYNIQVSNKYDSCRAEIRLDWYPYRGWVQNTPPYKPLISYHVIRIPEGGGPEEVIKVLADQDTSYIVPRVNENEKYTFYIKAERSDGVTASSYKTTRETTMPISSTFVTSVATQYNSQGLAEISFILDPAAQTYGYEFFGSSRPDYSFVSLGTFNIHDKAYFGELIALSAALKNDFINGYALLLIDSANLRVLVRSARTGRDENFLETALIPGGSIAVADIISRSTEKAGLNTIFSADALAAAVRFGEESMQGGPQMQFELACDNAVMQYLASSGYISFGPVPVLTHLARLEWEITAVRMILTGKLSGLAPETIRERLRDCNV